jgi:uncharacterized membrane protein (DUF2068 family)
MTTLLVKPTNKVLRVIAVLKFLETAAVIAAGLAALKLLNPATLDAIAAWSEALPGQQEQQVVQRVLDQLSGITQHEVRALGAGAILFAAIFLMEGIGLWLQRRWAEWLSVVATALFIPLEILELCRHESATKIIALVVNLLVVGYLVARIAAARLEHKLSSQ